MNAFTDFFKKTILARKIIFIVEDNEIYAKSLQGYLTIRFPEIDIKLFPDGESCLKELGENPKVIIMDHLLNTKNSDAATGLSTIKKIRAINPDASLILLSSQKEFEVVSKAISKYGCTYVQKDDLAFQNVEQLINVFTS